MQGTPEIRPARARVWPAGLLLLAALLLEWLDLDRAVARALFFHPAAHGWIGTGAGDWWARDLIHSDGRWLVRTGSGRLGIWDLRDRKRRVVGAHAVPSMLPAVSMSTQSDGLVITKTDGIRWGSAPDPEVLEAWLRCPMSAVLEEVAPDDRSRRGPDAAIGAPSIRLSLGGLHLCRARFRFAG